MAEEEQNVVEEEVPAEPDNNQDNQQQDQQPQEEEQQHQEPQQQQQQPQQQQQQRQAQEQPAFNFEGLRRQIPEEEDLSLMHGKIRRILGRTDAISSMKNRIDMIHKKRTFPKKAKHTRDDKPPLMENTSQQQKKRKIDKREVHVVVHNVQSLKDLMDEAMEGLVKVNNLQKQILNEIQTQVNARQGQDDPYAQAMQPGPSWAVAVPVTKRCAFCDGDLYACDCGRFYNLRDRRRCLFERGRCERCLLRATHLATSCPATSICSYCKSAKREKEMYSHYSAFCPFKFPM